MGLVNLGIPRELTLETKKRFGIENLVETGTWRGDSADFAAQHFSRVFTVEIDPERQRGAAERLRARPNVKCVAGDSPAALRQFLADIGNASTFFWLDAHASLESDCPLAEEIELINAANIEAYILVDDARYFLSPVPLPHSADNWPDLATVMKLLSNEQRRYVVVVDDMFIAYPKAARSFLIDYARSRPEPWSSKPGGVYFIPRDQAPNTVTRP